MEYLLRYSPVGSRGIFLWAVFGHETIRALDHRVFADCSSVWSFSLPLSATSQSPLAFSTNALVGCDGFIGNVGSKMYLTVSPHCWHALCGCRIIISTRYRDILVNRVWNSRGLLFQVGPVWPHFQYICLQPVSMIVIFRPATSRQLGTGEGLLARHYTQPPLPILLIGGDIQNFSFLFKIQC